jgi:hypothetical protein
LGERLLCKQEVVGSIPITSTTARLMLRISRREPRQRLRSNRESGSARNPRKRPRGAHEIDREEKVCAGALSLARLIFDKVKRE